MKAATVYSKLGWPVVPLHSAVAGVCSCAKGSDCPSAGKHPRLVDWTTSATSDADTVRAWAQQWPHGNVGVATGPKFWVLDIDGPQGAESLAKLTDQHGPLPLTVEQRTGSGGTHYLFAPVAGLKNTASRVAPGIDTRGEGGQIVVAPSVSAKGSYAWVMPPWTTPLADAPEWLLSMLRRPAPATAPAVSQAFPPASDDVLEAAREALAIHGPAIEGQGGDAHTWQACALLANDYALTDDEARPLLEEWNATCSPPWSAEDLEAKLRGGSKYASRPYGCKRGADAPSTATAVINAWLASGTGEAGMPAMVARVRELAKVCKDSVDHALIVNALMAATGLKKRDLDVPAPSHHEDVPPGSIQVTPELHQVADKATAAISPHVFMRCGVLCEVAKNEDRTFISDLETARIVDLMSRHSKWLRNDDKGLVTVAPPEPVARILHARRTHNKVRVLEAVTTAPVFLVDGSILQERGYSPQARVFLEPSVSVAVPDEPTRDDARAAILVLKGLLSDYRFAPGGFSAWLAGLLSPLVKSAIANAPAPLICVSAPSAGSGKSMLVDVAALIITGSAAEIRTYNPKDPAEWGKRVTAYVRAASPISVFDNCNGPFGDEVLDRLITATTWSDRILGVSDAPPIAVVSSWWATGNNIEPQGDTVRRALMVRMLIDDERPQERADFKIADLKGYTTEHRSELLSAALTILRAFHCAGRPDQSLPAWGSFTAWSALVRGALVWAGLVDPFVTQQRLAAELNEPDNEAHDFWIGAIEGTDGAPSSIAARAETGRPTAQEVLGLRESVTPHTLRRYVRRFVDKPRAGKRIRKDGPRYYVEVVA